MLCDIVMYVFGMFCVTDLDAKSEFLQATSVHGSVGGGPGFEGILRAAAAGKTDALAGRQLLSSATNNNNTTSTAAGPGGLSCILCMECIGTRDELQHHLLTVSRNHRFD